MYSTRKGIRKTRQSFRSLHSQIDDFDHDIFFDKFVSDMQENATVKEDTVYRKLPLNISVVI